LKIEPSIARDFSLMCQSFGKFHSSSSFCWFIGENSPVHPALNAYSLT
jgi:hypothetical protein